MLYTVYIPYTNGILAQLKGKREREKERGGSKILPTDEEKVLNSLGVWPSNILEEGQVNREWHTITGSQVSQSAAA